MKSTNSKLSKIFILPCVIMILFSSCVSYSTLQTPETLEPGHISIGGGTTMMLGNLFNGESPGFLPEVSGRIGISKGYDVGFKYSYPGVYMMDVKHQIPTTKINTAIDLGISVTNTSITNLDTDIFTIGFYPMVLIGKEFWYRYYQ